MFLEVLWGYGGDWIDAGTREVRIDSPEAVQAIEFLKGTIGTISPPAVTTYAEEDTRNIFQNGRAVFMRNWPYVWTLIQQSGGELKDQVGGGAHGARSRQIERRHAGRLGFRHLPVLQRS